MDIETAIAVALRAHKGQADKGGSPHILHPLAVMNRVDTVKSDRKKGEKGGYSRKYEFIPNQVPYCPRL